MDWTWHWIRESRFKSNIIPPDLGEGIWNRYRVRFTGCKNIVDRSKLFRNDGAGLLLPHEQPLLPLVIWSLELRLQLAQSLDHPGDEGLVLALLYSGSVRLGLPSILGSE